MTDSHPASARNAPRILIVDDHPAIHEDICKILDERESSAGLNSAAAAFFGETNAKTPIACYEIDSAYQGEEGFQLVQESIRNGRPYSLAFVDMRMPPGWDGMKTIQHLWQADPELQVVICTAYSDYSWREVVDSFGHNSRLLILKKPFDDAEVSQLAAALSEKRRLQEQANQYTSLLEKQVRQQTRTIRMAHEETIHRLVRASMFRDEETGAHIRRVGLFAAIIAEAAGWSDEDAEQIRMAAPMHDVGKIGIPDSVLQKPGPLTAEERKVMQTHTLIGAELLSQSDSPMLQMACEIALGHHEHWDGGGYPHQQKGADIPVAARIVGIVDVYDALTHDRVYRKALPKEKVMATLRAGSGTHFDAELLALFFERLPEIERVGKKNLDRPRHLAQPAIPPGQVEIPRVAYPVQENYNV